MTIFRVLLMAVQEPVPSGASGNDLFPSGMISDRLSHITPVQTHYLQIFIHPCPLWSSSPPSAIYWSAFKSHLAGLVCTTLENNID